MPPFVEGIKSILGELTNWLKYIVPALAILIIAYKGFQFSKTDEAHEIAEIKASLKRLLIGVAIVGGAAWLGTWLTGKFL